MVFGVVKFCYELMVNDFSLELVSLERFSQLFFT